MERLTHERLLQVLSYDKSTGVLRWRVTLSFRTKIGAAAGCPDKDGYIVIRIDGVLYKAHRLAWFHHYGVWPPGRLDHDNQIESDNRIGNLRPATAVQNGGNRPKTIRNTSGYKGVSRHRDKFVATIQCDGKWEYLGIFDTPEAAGKEYKSAAHLTG